MPRSTALLLHRRPVVQRPLDLAQLLTPPLPVPMLLAAMRFVPFNLTVVQLRGIKLASMRHFPYAEQVAYLPAPLLQWQRTSLAQPQVQEILHA